MFWCFPEKKKIYNCVRDVQTVLRIGTTLVRKNLIRQIEVLPRCVSGFRGYRIFMHCRETWTCEKKQLEVLEKEDEISFHNITYFISTNCDEDLLSTWSYWAQERKNLQLILLMEVQSYHLSVTPVIL